MDFLNFLWPWLSGFCCGVGVGLLYVGESLSRRQRRNQAEPEVTRGE